ncbi:MAG: formylglycine-generating enzyme family protein [Kiritimatiellae bacterium]|nr:formylglycine-generating enzyme family protein [Kiritimatiellia bacterium]
MKNAILLLAILHSFAAAFAASPRIVDGSVSIAKDAYENKYKITYRIEDAPGIVTVDIFTNEVSIGAACVVAGDVNKLVQPGETIREIWWTPISAPKGFRLSEEDGLSVKVTAWKKDVPPDYMVVRIENSEAILRYYTSSNLVPGGVGSELYKTDAMLFRKIPAAGASYIMGSPDAESKLAGRTDETQHEVRLTNDYYVAVFPMTKAQYKRLMRSTMYVPESDDLTPVIISYNSIRGSPKGSQWPENDEVEDSSILGVLRKRSGLRFDLLTEAEWEYACRAGTTTALNSGKDLIYQTGEDPNANEVAYYKYISGDVIGQVGCYAPNAWGIYDMHGCIYEWCLDWYKKDLGTSPVTSPTGPSSSEVNSRTLRGGYYKSQPKEIRSAFRTYKAPSENHNTTGVRLKCAVWEAAYSGQDGEVSETVNFDIGFGGTDTALFAATEDSPFISVSCRTKDSAGMNFISKPVGVVILFR